MRVWSSLCPEPSLQRHVGRLGVVDANASLICLWKSDEGTGSVVRNSRPLHPPRPARGAKAVVAADVGKSGNIGGRTGAEGHADLVGEWKWVPCFDIDDYESVADDAEGSSAAAGPPAVASAAGGASYSSFPAARRSQQGREGDLTPLAVTGGGSSGSVAAESPAPGGRGASIGSDMDLGRSLGWRSVSTAGDDEDEEDGEEKKHMKASSFVSSCVGSSPAGADAASAASAALGACVWVNQAAGVRNVSAREALLGILGKLFQQCSVYLAPCQGDPLAESLPQLRGSAMEARVQLQLVRREERALKAVVQPEVRPSGHNWLLPSMDGA